MKRRFDILFAIILVLILVIAAFIGNAILKGTLLLIFAGVLIINTSLVLKGKQGNKFRKKFFLGVLLFLEVVLAFSSLFVIISAIIK